MQKQVKNKLIEIKNDLFNISNRIKRVDENYFICFNKVLKQFEVHHKKQPDTTFCFVAGKTLNVSVLNKAIKTSVKFYLKNLKSMEEVNLKLNKKSEQNIKEKNMHMFKSLINYSLKNIRQPNFENCFTTKWV